MWAAACGTCDFAETGPTYTAVERQADRHELETGHRNTTVLPAEQEQP